MPLREPRRQQEKPIAKQTDKPLQTVWRMLSSINSRSLWLWEKLRLKRNRQLKNDVWKRLKRRENKLSRVRNPTNRKLIQNFQRNCKLIMRRRVMMIVYNHLLMHRYQRSNHLNRRHSPPKESTKVESPLLMLKTNNRLNKLRWLSPKLFRTRRRLHSL